MKRMIMAIFSYTQSGTKRMHQKIIRTSGKFQFISDNLAITVCMCLAPLDNQISLELVLTGKII
jgi:hypothetical protein